MRNHYETILNLLGSKKRAKKSIIEAAKYIDKNPIPLKRKSKIYFVNINDKDYSTKYLLDVAVFISKKKRSIETLDQNSIEANRLFENLGFQTLYKPEINDIQNEEYTSEKDGNQILKIHKSRERDSKLVRLVKENKLKEAGKLACEICDFDFFKVYGTIGKGYIEAHHIIPVSKIKNGDKTKLSDFALVCANCHRMLHNKFDKLLTVAQLKKEMK